VQRDRKDQRDQQDRPDLAVGLVQSAQQGQQVNAAYRVQPDQTVSQVVTVKMDAMV
jgi:hypothetical protein